MTRPRVDLAARIRLRGLDTVVDGVCMNWRVSRDELLGVSRMPLAVAARRSFARWLHEQRYTLHEIGWLIGRDHSTAHNLIHGKGWRFVPKVAS